MMPIVSQQTDTTTLTDSSETHTHNQGFLLPDEGCACGLVNNNDVQGKEMYFGEIKQT